MHAYVIATTPGNHVCVGRTKRVIDLDLAIARAESPRQHRRQTGRRSRRGAEDRRAPPEGIAIYIAPVVCCCVKSLRGQERLIDCGDTRRRFRLRGLAWLRASVS